MNEMDAMYAALADIPYPNVPPQPLTVEDLAVTARRLSGALGRKITPDDIEGITQPSSGPPLVHLRSGGAYALHPGNTAYVGDGVWMKNGAVYDPDRP